MSRALVILSGGQDSTTSLFWALQAYKEVHAITFDYNQRHSAEIEAAKKIAGMAKVLSHEVIVLGPVLKGSSPLVNKEQEVEHYDTVADLPGGVEPTFVPARNILFLAVAANRAAVLGCNHIVMGVCEADFGGYYDCRDKFIQRMADAISEGLDGKKLSREIVTPLMWLKKAETVKMAQELPGCMEALAYSHTCYDGQYPPNPHNHASLLRARGFHDAGVADPLIVRAKKENLLPQDYPDDGLVEGTSFGKSVAPGDAADPQPADYPKDGLVLLPEEPRTPPPASELVGGGEPEKV